MFLTHFSLFNSGKVSGKFAAYVLINKVNQLTIRKIIGNLNPTYNKYIRVTLVECPEPFSRHKKLRRQLVCVMYRGQWRCLCCKSGRATCYCQLALTGSNQLASVCLYVFGGKWSHAAHPTFVAAGGLPYLGKQRELCLLQLNMCD